MPNWGEVLSEIQGTRVDNPLDLVRRKYLRIMNEYTGRNVIAYYSGFYRNQRVQCRLTITIKMPLCRQYMASTNQKGLI